MASELETVAASFLIASPSLKDPNFDHAVVLMCMHESDGAMGLVVNHPAPITVPALLKQLEIEFTNHRRGSVLIGGPVAVESGVLLYQTAPDEAAQPDEIAITNELKLCPSQQILREIAEGRGPDNYHVVLGHAGWAPGQLEQEIAQGAWIPARLDLSVLFSMPMEQRWEGALLNEGLHPSALGSFRPQS